MRVFGRGSSPKNPPPPKRSVVSAVRGPTAEEEAAKPADRPEQLQILVAPRTDDTWGWRAQYIPAMVYRFQCSGWGQTDGAVEIIGGWQAQEVGGRYGDSTSGWEDRLADGWADTEEAATEAATRTARDMREKYRADHWVPDGEWRTL